MNPTYPRSRPRSPASRRSPPYSRSRSPSELVFGVAAGVDRSSESSECSASGSGSGSGSGSHAGPSPRSRSPVSRSDSEGIQSPISPSNTRDRRASYDRHDRPGGGWSPTATNGGTRSRTSTPYTYGPSTGSDSAIGLELPLDFGRVAPVGDYHHHSHHQHGAIASYALTPGLTTGTGTAAGSLSSRPTSTFGMTSSDRGDCEEDEDGPLLGGDSALGVVVGGGMSKDMGDDGDKLLDLRFAGSGSGAARKMYKGPSEETSVIMALPRQSFSGGQRPMGPGGSLMAPSISLDASAGGAGSSVAYGSSGAKSAGPIMMSGIGSDGVRSSAVAGAGGLFSGPSTTIASAQSSPGPAGPVPMGLVHSGIGHALGGGLRGLTQTGSGESSASGAHATGAGRMAAAAQRAREKAGSKSGSGAGNRDIQASGKDDASSSGGGRPSKRRPLPPSHLPGPAPPTDDRHPLSERSLALRGYKSHIIFNHIFHLESRWSALRELGQGAYGLVISAQDSLSGEAIAIKMLTRVFDKVILARRCLREVTLLRHLNGHENITGLIDLDVVVDDFNEIYMFMEPMEADLHQIIRSGQQLTNSHITYFLYQLLRGMKYVHSANVIHRDLKPGNLLVNADCELKICDFGLARGFVPDPTEWDPNSMGPGGPLTEYVATRWYRAPEIMLSYKRYGTAIDVWSIGCILAELLGGKPLFKGKDYIDQLNLILELVGTPDDATLDAIGSDRACAYIRSLPISPPVALSTVFPSSESLAIDLLSKFLVFDPAKRISVREALKHPYLAAYHDETDEPDCPYVFDKWEEVENVQTVEEFRLAIGREVEGFRQEVRAVDDWQTDEDGGGATGGGGSASEGENSRSPPVRRAEGLPPSGLGEAAEEVLIDPLEGSVRNSASSTPKTGGGPGTPRSATSEESFSNSAPSTRGRRGSTASGVLGDPFKRRSGSSFGLSSMVGMTPLNSDAGTNNSTDATFVGPGTGMIRHNSRSSFSSEFGGSRMKSRQTSTASTVGRPLIRALSQLSVTDLHSHAAHGPHGNPLSPDGPPPMSVSPADAPPSEAPLTFGTRGKIPRLPLVEGGAKK